MPFTVTITAYPDLSGAFAPDSFDHLLQRHIAVAALSPTWTHTLIDARVADDGSSAELVVASEPAVVHDLEQTLRVVDQTPPARVRVVDVDGAVLVEGSYPAPLRVGQDVAVGDRHYRVTDTAYPGRDPETGVCAGGIDWQVATVTASAPPDTVPVAAVPAPAGGGVG